MAEGIAVKNVGKLTLPVIRELVSEIVLVDEAHLERAVNAYLTLQKTMAEGAGAAGLAAMLAKPRRFGGKKVGLILCGGNIDPRILASIMVRELERESHIVSFRLTIPDRPGVLGLIATRLGALGANILEVEHRRLFLDVPAKGASSTLRSKRATPRMPRKSWPRSPPTAIARCASSPAWRWSETRAGIFHRRHGTEWVFARKRSAVKNTAAVGISFHDCSARHDSRCHCAHSAMQMLPSSITVILE